MNIQDSIGPSCSLDERTLKQRISAIENLNRRALVGPQITGHALIVEYPRAALAEINDFLASERECCSFLDFQVEITADNIKMKITVPEELAENAEVLLGPFYTAESKDASCCSTCR